MYNKTADRGAIFGLLFFTHLGAYFEHFLPYKRVNFARNDVALYYRFNCENAVII